MDAHEVIRHAERELADGGEASMTMLERAHRELLDLRDAEGLKGLLDVAVRAPGGDELADTIRQDLSFLTKRASPWPASAIAPPPVPTTAKRARKSLFGDPRRPRSLALALIASMLTFPFAWVGFLILWYIGGTTAANRREGLDHAHGVITIAAAVPILAIIGTSIDWLVARRRYPREPGASGFGAAGVAWTAAVLFVAGATSLLAFMLWTTPI